ncbi:MAG: hypothetical protein IPL84_07025 [Chitinophagaceae bacterium]|nr:hypothetical protein [Chitinophagaceae bacterium]
MKKFKNVLTAIVMLLATSAFATEPVNVSPVVKAAFENDFSKARQVIWEKTSDFYFASFTLNEVKVDAAYSEKGELLGTARRITTAQMPLSISLAIAERYAGYTVDNSAVELTFEGVTRYYVKIENEMEALKLKCLSNGDMELDQRTKK